MTSPALREFPPLIELILRAGEAATKSGRGDLAGLQKAVDATAALEPLPPRLNAVRLTAVKLLAAVPAGRAGWCETLAGHLRELDDGIKAPGGGIDAAVIDAAWRERADLK